MLNTTSGEVVHRAIGPQGDAMGASLSLAARSFEAFEASLLLPRELASLSAADVKRRFEDRRLTVVLPAERVDLERGLRVCDDLLDALVGESLRERAAEYPYPRAGLVGADTPWVVPRELRSRWL